MNILGFHTAGPACEIALLRDGEIVAECRESMSRGQDARLPGLTAELLSNAQLAMADIDRFAAITGPGSFTGIRVGVAFARGLALATGKPCLGVTSLEASLPAGQQGSAIVALAAQRRPPEITFWTQSFRSGEATGAAEETTLETLEQRLRSHPHMLYGSAADCAAHFPDLVIHETRPTAARAAQLSEVFDPDAQPARPTYARAPDAALPSRQAAD